METIDGPSMAVQAREALTAFLTSYSWDAFVTSTFIRPVRDPRRALELVSNRLPLGHLGRSFLAAERYYLGGYHVHGLAAFRDSTSGRRKRFAMDHAKAGLERLGWSRVSDVHFIGGAAGYCAKYLTKQNEIDYDFYGDFGWIVLED